MLGSVSGGERIGPFRSRSSVRADLCGLGIKAGLFRQMGAKYALRRYSEGNYQAVLGLIERAHRLKLPIAKIEVRRSGAVREGDFSSISDSDLRARAIEGTLKIASLMPQQTDQVGNLADVLRTAQKKFQLLVENPSSTLEEVFPVLTDIINSIRIRNISVYVPVENDAWARIFCSNPWPQDGGTKYPYPTGEAPITTLASTISAPGDFFRVDIGVKPGESSEEARKRIEAEFKEQGITPDWTSIGNDRERSHGDGRLLIFKIRSAGGSRTLGVFQVHNLVAEREEALPLFKNSQDEDRIIGLLRAIFEKAAVAIDKIRERKNVLAENSTAPQAAKPLPAFLSPDLFIARCHALVETISQWRRIGRFKVARLENPGATLASESLTLLAKAVNWHQRHEEDIKNHLMRATALLISFDDKTPTAFGAAVDLPLINHGKKENLLVMAGTMTKPGYFGYGLQTIVNGLFMITSRWKYKFRAPFPIMRTRSVVPAVGFIRHFSSVTFESLDERQLVRARTFSRHLDSDCDSNGITRNAYEQPVMDRERDEQVLANLRGAVTESQFSGFSLPCDQIIDALKKAGYINSNNEINKKKLGRRSKYFELNVSMGKEELAQIHKILIRTSKEKDLKIYKKVVRAFEGLTEYDARVFQGKLSWWDTFKILFYIYIIYGRSKNGHDKKSLAIQ